MSSVLHSTRKASPRYSGESREKSTGATYTPELLAGFVADQILATLLPQEGAFLRVLDPAVGDGALLAALITRLPQALRENVLVTGFDTDAQALEAASRRLNSLLRDSQIALWETDFLTNVLETTEGLFSTGASQKFDIVIANPPYVRTQIMGATQAQLLALSFGLTGRVDLYYPFLLGIARVLAPHGVAGVITSNRFMTTKSGQAVRRSVLAHFDVVHAWDLGDTKLFEAAVLPAVLLARGRHAATSDSAVRLTSIYETSDKADGVAPNAIAALVAPDDSVVAIPDGRRFRIRSGVLANGGNVEGVWRVATDATDGWLAKVQANTWSTFGRIGKIRVGVKSTADKIFVRNDWDSLPSGRPELLRPLLTRRFARQYRAATPINEKHRKEILYPHDVGEDGKRRAVDLSFYPNAKRYLEAHRERLESRTYVIDSGRAWYEIWVPHDPAAWSRPKLIFPDISEKPVFWMDLDGGVVSGECYWLQCENRDEVDLLWLALAVANSTFATSFYDHKFSNKLYAGRRRFITQYVEHFPIPDPRLDESRSIVELTKRIYEATPSPAALNLAAELDARVWRAFGLPVKEVAR